MLCTLIFSLLFSLFFSLSVSLLAGGPYYVLNGSDEQRTTASLMLLFFSPMAVCWLWNALRMFLSPLRAISRLMNAVIIYSPKHGVVNNVSPRQSMLIAMIERLSHHAGLHTTPTIAIIESNGVNGMAYGKSDRNSLIAVTRWALEHLPERLLEALVAHELGHIHNQDTIQKYLSFMVFQAIYRITIRFRGLIQTLLLIGVAPYMIYLALMQNAAGQMPSLELFEVAFLIAFGLLAPRLISRGVWLINAWLGKRAEFQADQFAARLISTQQCLDLLAVLDATQDQSNDNRWAVLATIFDTHPSSEHRIRALETS